MNDYEVCSCPEPILMPDGSLRCGNVVHEAWPSLRIRPLRSLGYIKEILRPIPGSAFESYAQQIPNVILTLARALPSRPFSALELCGTNPERGLELLQHCPALAVLVINSYVPAKHGDRRTYFAGALGKPWRGILGDLGLPPTAATIRILRKIPRDQCTSKNLRRLSDLLRRKNHRWRHVLSHLPGITRDTLGLFLVDPALVSPRLLIASASSSFEEEPIRWTLASIVCLRADLGESGAWPYASLDFDALKLVEGRLTDRAYPNTAALFPPPPFPGRRGKIVPLVDWEGLVREAESQGNSPLTFLAEILVGTAYLYKVDAAERATLALTREAPTGDWKVHDLRAAHNAAVSAAAIEYVHAWLKSAASHAGNLKSDSIT